MKKIIFVVLVSSVFSYQAINAGSSVGVSIIETQQNATQAAIKLALGKS